MLGGVAVQALAQTTFDVADGANAQAGSLCEVFLRDRGVCSKGAENTG
jgi:hypothetical protein